MVLGKVNKTFVKRFFIDILLVIAVTALFFSILF